ncbi:ankyrin repeat domain-containing protein [Micrococcales bacterium 31B]|nr:ankyrin repeat domain-containing protein [Micrococcales bacterium 31B]
MHNNFSQSPPPSDSEVLGFSERLFDLARAGDASLLTYLNDGVPANLADHNGNSLLMLAAYHGHADLVLALADLGANVDATNDRGQTPLAGAAFKGFVAVVAALLECGADPLKGTPNAVQTAEYFQRSEVVGLFAR